MRFRLVPKSMTLDDLERLKRHSCRNKKSFTEPTRKKLNEEWRVGQGSAFQFAIRIGSIRFT